MKNESKSTAPDASYINGKPYSGRMPERDAKRQKKPAPQASGGRRPASKEYAGAGGRADAAAGRSGAESRSPESVREESSHHHSSHGSHRRKKESSFGKFLKSYGLTVAALIGVAIIAAVLIVTNTKNETDAKETQQDIYVPADLDFTVSTDFIELTDAEAKSSVVFPVSSKYLEDGRPDVIINRSDDGKVVGAIYHQYLDSGSLIVRKEYGETGLLDTKTVYSAVEEGCTESVFTIKRGKGNAFEGYTLDEIDDTGAAKKRTEYTVTGVVDHYSYLEYNDMGQLSKEAVYSSFDMLMMYYEYLYDGEGRKIEQLQYDANYQPVGKTTWEYDGMDRVVKESYFMNEVCRSYIEYNYEEDGSYVMTSYTLVDEATMTYEKKVMK